MSVVRPFEEQTPLEKTLRAHLWSPRDNLERAQKDLPGHIKRKEYAAAASCQERISRAEREIVVWEHLLALYEDERAAIAKKITVDSSPPGV